MSDARSIARPQLTVVTPVYNEEAGLERYRQQVEATLLNSEEAECSVLFVDDGSQDRSWEIITRICAEDARFQGLRLSRNFGSHTAISAGFNAAQGDLIATLACDLQDPPETILGFLQAWREGASVVWGRRRSRQDENWRIWTSRLFQEVVRRHAMPRETKFTTGSFLLVDQQVAQCVRQFHEQHRIVFALVAWTGFEQAVVDYDRAPRRSGCS
ncbi:MAG: glycosyltransferase family 2 protein, partial [Magnetococcales bacterium]|nr:glycosyltransferase family 2 protein [Magnetococcales bacterium]